MNSLGSFVRRLIPYILIDVLFFAKNYRQQEGDSIILQLLCAFQRAPEQVVNRFSAL